MGVEKQKKPYIRKLIQLLEIDNNTIPEVNNDEVNSESGGWHNAYLCH